MLYNSGIIMLVISNRPHAMHSANLKLLTHLLPELYFTQSNYYYKLSYLGHPPVSCKLKEKQFQMPCFFLKEHQSEEGN